MNWLACLPLILPVPPLPLERKPPTTNKKPDHARSFPPSPLSPVGLPSFLPSFLPSRRRRAAPAVDPQEPWRLAAGALGDPQQIILGVPLRTNERHRPRRSRATHPTAPPSFRGAGGAGAGPGLGAVKELSRAAASSLFGQIEESVKGGPKRIEKGLKEGRKEGSIGAASDAWAQSDSTPSVATITFP